MPQQGQYKGYVRPAKLAIELNRTPSYIGSLIKRLGISKVSFPPDYKKRISPEDADKVREGARREPPIIP